MTAASSRDTAPLNPRWVLTTLRQRGVREPQLSALTSEIGGMTPASIEELRSRVSRMCAGTDRPEDMTWMAQWSAGLEAHTPSNNKPEPAANDHDHEDGSASERRATVESSRPRRGQSFEPSHHVYGAKAALCMELVRVEPKDGESTDGYATLQLEFAGALARNRYDWERKIIFRLTKREVPLLAACLLGWCKKLEFSGHGPANDKVFEIEDQAAHFFIKVRQGRRAIALPMGGDELFPVTAMVLKTMGENAPHLDSQTLVQIAKRVGEVYGRSTAVGRSQAE